MDTNIDINIGIKYQTNWVFNVQILGLMARYPTFRVALTRNINTHFNIYSRELISLLLWYQSLLLAMSYEL
jgi:hypothetical protein